MLNVEAVRADFPGATQQVYLNAAGVGLPPRAAVEAVQRATALLGQGPAEMGYKAYYQAIGAPASKAKEEAARLLHATPQEIAFIDDTTMGLNIALAAIPFSRGENLILCDLEYPQVAISAAHPQQRHDIEIRVAHHRNGIVTVDDYAKLIDKRTRVLLVSSVQWINYAWTWRRFRNLQKITIASWWLMRFNSSERSRSTCLSSKWIFLPLAHRNG
jgi:selenocysteine lyase/cysteine desulfurase